MEKLPFSSVTNRQSQFWKGSENSRSAKDNEIITAFCEWKRTENECQILKNDMNLILKHANEDIAKLELLMESETRLYARKLMADKINALQDKADLIEDYFAQ